MHRLLLLFGLSLSVASCIPSSGDVQMKPLNGNWNKKAEQVFDIDIQDAQNPKNLIFVVRNNNSYPYSNIRLIVNFEDVKNKKKETDTLNYILAKPNGEWIGTGFGETKETLFQYKMNYKFPQNGAYKIGVIQAMRHDTLRGIEDIGIRVEPVKP